MDADTLESLRAQRTTQLKSEAIAKVIAAREPFAVLARIGANGESAKAQATLVLMDALILEWTR
jgi:hypothetical protein